MNKSLSLKIYNSKVEKTMMVNGFIDFVSRKLVFGWALNAGRTAKIKIFIDDQFYKESKSDKFRADLKRKGVSDGYSGFRCLWNLPRTDRPIKVSVMEAETETHLTGSPVILPPISEVENFDNPDWYTKHVKEWLDNRFQNESRDGVFFAHQPIYGFGSKYSEPGWYDRYALTYHILNVVRSVKGKSLLDVGGAEGYKAAIIRKFTSFKDVMSTDLSASACQKAEEIYGLKTKVIDGHKLPFPDNSFDIVLSSETLEHMSEPESAIPELIRVARRAVLITVPADTEEEVIHNIVANQIHGHINLFTLESFNNYSRSCEEIIVFPCLANNSGILKKARAIEEFPVALSIRLGLPSLEKPLRLLQKSHIFKKYMSELIADDINKSEQIASYRGIISLLIKDPSCVISDPTEPKVDPMDVLNFSVPHEVIGK